MTEIIEMQTFLIATARLKVQDLRPNENKAHYRNKRMKFIEKCCRGEYISRADKQNTILTPDEIQQHKKMKTKEYNTRFRERYKDALNAYMNAKMKERYRTMPEFREAEKAKARLRHRRNKERKVLEAAVADFHSTIERACLKENHI